MKAMLDDPWDDNRTVLITPNIIELILGDIASLSDKDDRAEEVAPMTMSVRQTPRVRKNG